MKYILNLEVFVQKENVKYLYRFYDIDYMLQCDIWLY